MPLSHDTQAVLLLTVRLTSRGAGSAVRPLTNTEWSRFARWLREEGRRPEHLLGEGRARILAGWRDEKIPRGRLEDLLDRGPALALALDRWLGAGLWVLTRADAGYPERLERRLGRTCPPVLFGCGDEGLLGRGGLAVVGSRNAPPDDLAYSRRLGARAAESGITIVSGGARGIDEEAMSGALEAGGAVLGVLASDLLRATAGSSHRPRLLSGDLALISPYQPEARFDVGKAMGRNRYVYCLADAAVAVRSGRKGGTWAGATETLKRGWVPVWVRPGADPSTGNAGLIELGARPLAKDPAEIDPAALFARTETGPGAGGASSREEKPRQRSLFEE